MRQYDVAELILGVLEKRLSAIKGDEDISHRIHLCRNDLPAIRNGLRVLEAAGKVDKEKAIVTLRQLYHLLEAISGPDEAGERRRG